MLRSLLRIGVMLLCIAPPGKCCHFPGRPHQSWNGFPESLGVPISWKIWNRPSSTSTATTNFWMVCQHLGMCWKTFSSRWQRQNVTV